MAAPKLTVKGCFIGDDIQIEEMPQGCFVSNIDQKNGYVLISSPTDAVHLINSLIKMLTIQFPNHEYALSFGEAKTSVSKIGKDIL